MNHVRIAGRRRKRQCLKIWLKNEAPLSLVIPLSRHRRFLMLIRSAARVLPALLAVFFAASAFAQKTSDQKTVSFVPEPAPNADADPESFVSRRLYLGENVWLQPHIFVRAQGSTSSRWNVVKGQTEDDNYMSKSFSLKNARISLDMQLTRYLTLFYQSDDVTADAEYRNGELKRTYGRKSNSLYTKDAYLHFIPARQFQIYAGLLTVPASRANLTSDAGLLGTDLTAFRPEFGFLSHCGRDTGVVLRGIFLKSIIDYRIGVFRGIQNETYTDETTGKSYKQNRKGYPRVSGRIQLSIMDAEDGYFLSENYLLKRSIFGVGLSADYQPGIFQNNKDYMAWSGDVPINVPLTAMYVMTAMASVTSASNYPDWTGAVYDGFFSFNAQGGLLFAGTWEPVAKFTYTKLTGAGLEYKSFHVGGNYYYDGNRFNVKTDIALPFGKNKHYPDEWKGVIQCQLYL